MHQCLILSVQLKDFFAKKKKFHRPKVRSLPWLVGLWCSCRILFFKFLDLSKLLHGFVNFVPRPKPRLSWTKVVEASALN